ncbi:MAG: hypothetical protein B1H13_06485 [Desulfobacteraceae bacterium 4484_190.3]|nr:MAG: hypothetical protein B1H13_06485 [Desulfobacteraceae bacterium 4484_190.3]
MAQDSVLQSLIPYLDSTEHPFVLKIAFPAPTPHPRDNNHHSFIILNDANPLSRLFMGKLVTRNGSPLKDLYLLVQRDEPHFSPDLPHLRNNADIDHAWQEAVRFFSTSRNDVLSFTPETPGEKDFHPFQPLFYCAFRDLFLHPPCPSCGAPLELCTDNEVLEAAGLPPYAVSLQRYLYCPSCIAAGNGPLFFILRGKDDDLPVVKDLQFLIREFGKVLGNAEASLPCTSCPEATTCYGHEEKAGNRIIPFSFFPFYLLVFDSYPVDALNLLKSPLPKAASPEIEVQEQPPKQAEPARDAPVEEPETDPAAVLEVLLSLRKKWAAAIPKPAEPPAEKEEKTPPAQDMKELPVDMLEKTMIFSPAEMDSPGSAPKTPAGKELPPDASSEPPQAPPGEVVLEKTMIFSPGTVPGPSSATKKPASPKPEVPTPEDLLEKTVISSPEGKKQETPEQKKKARETEAIPETVIMSLDDLKGKK